MTEEARGIAKIVAGEKKKEKEGVHVVRVPFRFRDVIARQMWK